MVERVKRKIRIHPDYVPVKKEISDLFKSLRKSGFVARMNFSCCGSCGSYECNEIATKQHRNKIAFYHRQEEDRFKSNGKIYLHYYYTPDSDDKLTKIVGEEIKRHVESCPNLEVVWDNDPATCIILQRRGRSAEENSIV